MNRRRNNAARSLRSSRREQIAMNDDKRHIAVAGLLQVFAVVAGFLLLGAVMKFNGWPEETVIRWRPLPRYLREYGVWTLLIPVVWVLVTIIIGSFGKSEQASAFAIAFGYLFALLILILFLWAAFNPYRRPLFWSPPKSSSAMTLRQDMIPS
jgi:hypothetical protein